MPGSPTESDTPLLPEKQQDFESGARAGRTDGPSRRDIVRMLITLALNVVLGTALTYTLAERSTMALWLGTPHVFSPVAHVLTHKEVEFTEANSPMNRSRSLWDGPPNDTTDFIWQETYDMGAHAIPGWMAKQVTEPTSQLTGLEDRYLVGLDVFHQIHCINSLRKYQTPRRWAVFAAHRRHVEPGFGMMDHLDHCVNTLRQSLMCAADRTINGFQWVEDRAHGNAPATTHGAEHGGKHGGGEHGGEHKTEHGGEHGGKHGGEHGSEHGSEHGGEHGGKHGTEHGTEHGEHKTEHGTEHGEHKAEHGEHAEHKDTTVAPTRPKVKGGHALIGDEAIDEEIGDNDDEIYKLKVGEDGWKRKRTTPARRLQVSTKTVHVCRDFSVIQEWGLKNRSPFKYSQVEAYHGALPGLLPPKGIVQPDVPHDESIVNAGHH